MYTEYYVNNGESYVKKLWRIKKIKQQYQMLLLRDSTQEILFFISAVRRYNNKGNAKSIRSFYSDVWKKFACATEKVKWQLVL